VLPYSVTLYKKGVSECGRIDEADAKNTNDTNFSVEDKQLMHLMHLDSNS
jgi:hypothetical protein